MRRVRRSLDDAGARLVGRRVVAMCSGGVDSVVLVHVLSSLPTGAAPRSIDVLWCDHGLRPDVSCERAAAQRVATDVGATFHERSASQMPARSRARGVQAAARDWRYGEALELARSVAADVVATGHTADDHVETILAGILADAGLAGLAGIPTTRPLAHDVDLVRPMLALSRADVLHIAHTAALAWAEDPTNADPRSGMRAHIRHVLLPALAAGHEGAAPNLVRLARAASSHASTVNGLAGALVDEWEQPDGSLLLDAVRALPGPARRALLASWLARHGVGRARTERVVVAVARAVDAGAPGDAVNLADGRCVRRGRYHLAIGSAGPTAETVDDAPGERATTRSAQ